MLFRKNKKDENQNRRRYSDNVEGRASKFTYHSVRSNRETNVGRSAANLEPKDRVTPVTRWWQHIPTLLAILVVIGSILYAVSLTTNPNIDIVDQSNQNIVQPIGIYQSAAHKILGSTLLNRSKLTINTDKLESEFQNQFPELNAVTIVIPVLGNKPTFEIRPSQSIMILYNNQGQFVINQQGNAVIKLGTSEQKSTSLPVVKDDSGLYVSLGKQVLTGSSIVFIKTVIDQFAAKNIPIQSITLSTTPYELDVQVRGVPYYIKFNLLTDPLYATGTYFATLKLFNSSNPAPTQYIDIRIPGRAYYR